MARALRLQQTQYRRNQSHRGTPLRLFRCEHQFPDFIIYRELFDSDFQTEIPLSPASPWVLLTCQSISLCRRSHTCLTQSCPTADSPLLPCPVTCSSVFSLSPTLPSCVAWRPACPPLQQPDTRTLPDRAISMFRFLSQQGFKAIPRPVPRLFNVPRSVHSAAGSNLQFWLDRLEKERCESSKERRQEVEEVRKETKEVRDRIEVYRIEIEHHKV